MSMGVFSGGANSGMTSFGSMARRGQYSRLMRTSRGAEATTRAFLRAKRRGKRVASARRAVENVIVERERPMTVRYWRCQP
jgi:hypothetical protein